MPLQEARDALLTGELGYVFQYCNISSGIRDNCMLLGAILDVQDEVLCKVTLCLLHARGVIRAGQQLQLGTFCH
jgi:hypothetical protein